MNLDPEPDQPALFRSAAGMASATNYSDWTFSLFEPYLRGDVLEVGCGVGTFTRLLVDSGRCRSLLSIDVSADAVAHCRANIQSPILEVKHTGVESVNGAFDLVICMNVLEHIEDDLAAFRHMLGLLRPGGTLFLLVPAHQALYTPFDREGGHYRRYSKRDVTRLLAKLPEFQPAKVDQYYFNSIGALGYYAVYGLMRKQPTADPAAEVGWFDRLVVPVLRKIERNKSPFGISLVNVITKGRES